MSNNNPTGNSFNKKNIEILVQSFKGIVVIDEAYIDFSSQSSCIDLLRKYTNLVIMQTFSKAWGLAGIRLGMAFASTTIIQLLNKVKPPYNINQLTQQTASEALGKRAGKEQWVTQVLAERMELREGLAALSFVQKIYPSDANFLLIKVAAPNELYNYLTTQQIIVRNRSTVVLCEGCLRITIGTKEENHRLLTALNNYKRP